MAAVPTAPAAQFFATWMSGDGAPVARRISTSAPPALWIAWLPNVSGDCD
jgi:hypothetical protein